MLSAQGLLLGFPGTPGLPWRAVCGQVGVVLPTAPKSCSTPRGSQSGRVSHGRRTGSRVGVQPCAECCGPSISRLREIGIMFASSGTEGQGRNVTGVWPATWPGRAAWVTRMGTRVDFFSPQNLAYTCPNSRKRFCFQGVVCSPELRGHQRRQLVYQRPPEDHDPEGRGGHVLAVRANHQLPGPCGPDDRYGGRQGHTARCSSRPGARVSREDTSLILGVSS